MSRTVPNPSQRRRDLRGQHNQCVDCQTTGGPLVLRSGDRVCYAHTVDPTHPRYDGTTAGNGLNWSTS